MPKHVNNFLFAAEERKTAIHNTATADIYEIRITNKLCWLVLDSNNNRGFVLNFQQNRKQMAHILTIDYSLPAHLRLKW